MPVTGIVNCKMGTQFLKLLSGIAGHRRGFVLPGLKTPQKTIFLLVVFDKEQDRLDRAKDRRLLVFRGEHVVS
jgi:hypothetical protein